MTSDQLILHVLYWTGDCRNKNADTAYAFCDYLHLLIISHLKGMVLEWNKLLQRDIRDGFCFCGHVQILL